MKRKRLLFAGFCLVMASANSFFRDSASRQAPIVLWVPGPDFSPGALPPEATGAVLRPAPGADAGGAGGGGVRAAPPDPGLPPPGPGGGGVSATAAPGAAPPIQDAGAAPRQDAGGVVDTPPPAPASGGNATAGLGVSLSIQDKVALLRQDARGEAAPPPPGVSLGALALQGLGAVAVGQPEVASLSVQDKVEALRRGSDEALRNAVRDKVRARSFEAMSGGDVPWAGRVVKASVLGYPENSSEACNPMGMSCECLGMWYGRDVCAELPHRQKPEVRMTFHDRAWWQPNAVDVGVHDCPTTRCHLALGATHKPDSQAFIGPLKPGRFYPSIFFPPKLAEGGGRNVMVNFEGAGKYKVLTDHNFYVTNKIDVYGSHTGEPVPVTLTGPGLLSFLDLSDLDRPPQSFRVRGPPFAERNDSLALFVSHCRGTRARSMLLELFSRVSNIISFGDCSPSGAIYAPKQVVRHYPQCADAARVGKMAEKECVLRHSKFALAIENTEENHYVTEKLYQALAMGAVPIYWGAPNVRDLLPHPEAAILVKDFQTPALCMDYVRQVAANEALWLKHTAWKDAAFSPGFNRVLRHQRGAMFCRVCEHLGDKMAPAEPSLKGALSECAFAALSRAAGGMAVPPVDPYAALGVDAAMLVGSGGGVPLVLGVTPAKVPAAESASAEEVQCAAAQVRRDALVHEGMGAEQARGVLFRVAVALFRALDDGMQNTLVVGSPGPEAAWGLGGNREVLRGEWRELMRQVPPDYDVVVISPRGSVGAAVGAAGLQPVAERPHLAGEWLVSRKGAQALLGMRGDEALKVYLAGDVGKK